MALRGSQLSRVIRFFKEADVEEAQYVYDRAGTILAERAGMAKPKAVRKKRKSKANGATEQMEAQQQAQAS